MKIVLRDHECYVNVLGKVKAEEDGRTVYLSRPELFVVEECEIVTPNDPHRKVIVKALLDTGNDITIVMPEKIKELENLLGYELPLKRGRKIEYYGDNGQRMEPVFDLVFIFPGGHSCSSKYGFIVPLTRTFDVAEVWLGQDIFRQFVTTFNGVEGTVTIVDPKAQSIGLKGWLQSSLRKLLSFIY